MTEAQLAKSHLANSTHADGHVAFDLAAMPEYKLMGFLRAVKKDALRYKAEREAMEKETES